jgi:hypothetical protein
MRRKKSNSNEQLVNNIKKKKSIINPPIGNGSGDKTLFDFWKPNRDKGKEKNSLRSKSKSIADEIVSMVVDPKPASKTFNLVKNPSKQCLIAPTITQNTVDYKNKILFNENFVENLKILLEPFLNMNKKSLFSQNFGDKSMLELEVYEDYTLYNLDSILTKFLLQMEDKFLFVPKCFMTKEEGIDKTKLKLFEGFNDLKYVSLQYYPENSKEVIDNILIYLIY